MARKRRLKITDSNESGSDVNDETPVESSHSDTCTVVVASHTHAGVSYKSGDPFLSDNPATIRKLKARGIIS